MAGKSSVLTGRNLERDQALTGRTLVDVYGLWDKDGGNPLRYEENTAELATTLSSPLSLIRLLLFIAFQFLKEAPCMIYAV